ncbi:Pheromone receptor Rcb2 B44 [Mycena indigotica]|uniref:Pheromone receptor Rcb2 B44 n=1 Tax=Mycena indigotica TaxID=2126181 RepID=A0A8H6SCI1_9AGAR|nr:Pheromone receptor Rcb2 B44 [Mycena indigotica]KAF7296899.1 Pheromone receptor Rcb2 B44 [Mycena indigotica]
MSRFLPTTIHASEMHYELPIGAFLASALVLLPVPWHWRARNIPTLSIVAWLFVSNLQLGVSAIIWADSIRKVAPVWCDIATKLQVGATMALPACCLSLCIHLERIASVRQVQSTPSQKRRRMFFDLTMCWGLPILSMALHYIVQGHRFDIVQDFGCKPAVYVSVPAILVIHVPVLIVVFATLIFASAALYHFFRRRITFARHLQDSSSALTPSRYFRLMAMALVQMVWATFLTLANLLLTIRGGLLPYTSWADVHAGFGYIGVFPRAFIPANHWAWAYFTFWSMPATALLFLVFFAFGQDAMAGYRSAFASFRKMVGFPPKPKKARVPSMPTFNLPRFPQLDKDSFSTSSEAHAPATPASFHAKSVTETDIPLTPSSATSFSTIVACYHPEHKPQLPSLDLTPHTIDMA